MNIAGKLGVMVTIAYMALLGHEVATGALFVREVALKLAVSGMTPFAAHNLAAVIIFISPLIAITGLLGFAKK